MKTYYVVSWNFRNDAEFTNYEDAIACFNLNAKINSVSYLELKKVSRDENHYYAESIKIWHK